MTSGSIIVFQTAFPQDALHFMNQTPSAPKLLHSLPWYLFIGATLVFVAACLAKPGAWLWADMVWLILAAINLHLINSQIYGLKTARRWLLIVIACAFATGVINTQTGVVLGHVRFHKTFGSGLLGVPAGWLLLWVVLIFSARSIASWVLPRSTYFKVVLFTAALVMTTILNVLPLAVVQRNWWTVLAQESASGIRLWPWLIWLIIPAALAFCLREPSIQKPSDQRRGAIILILFNLCALLSRVG